MFLFKFFSFFSFDIRNSLLHNIIIINIVYSPFFLSLFYVKIKQIISEFNNVNNLIKAKEIINNFKNNNNMINYNNSDIIKELYNYTFQGVYITNINNKEIKGKIKIIFRKEFYDLYFLDAFLYKNNQNNIFLISNTFPFSKNYSFSIKKENKNLFNIKTVNDIIITSLNKHLFNFKKKYNFGNIFLLYYNISKFNEKYLLGYFDINGTKFFFSTKNDKHSLISQLNFIGKLILLLSIFQLVINFLIFDVTLLDKYEAIKYSSYSIIINLLSLTLILIQSLFLSFIDKVKSKFIIIIFFIYKIENINYI